MHDPFLSKGKSVCRLMAVQLPQLLQLIVDALPFPFHYTSIVLTMSESSASVSYLLQELLSKQASSAQLARKQGTNRPSMSARG